MPEKKPCREARGGGYPKMEKILDFIVKILCAKNFIFMLTFIVVLSTISPRLACFLSRFGVGLFLGLYLIALFILLIRCCVNHIKKFFNKEPKSYD